jgi:hypothetical protein
MFSHQQSRDSVIRVRHLHPVKVACMVEVCRNVCGHDHGVGVAPEPAVKCRMLLCLCLL